MVFSVRYLTIFFFTLISSVFGKGLEIKVVSESAILINADSGAVLFEKNSQMLQYPASTTKVATALYALKQAGNDLDEMVEAEKEAIASITSEKKKKANYRNPPYWVEVGSNHMGIKHKERMPLRALLYGMMLASANDAANVIAQYIGGTIPGFMYQMNEYLKQIGCQETNFLNPHGLHHPDHQTTASDLAKIMREALHTPFFAEIVGTAAYLAPETNMQSARTLLHTTKLMRKNTPFYYSKAVGAKLGRTTDALYSLVAIARHQDRTLIAVVLRCPEQKDLYQDVKTLFEAAFSEAKIHRRILNSGAQDYTRKVKGAKTLVKTYSVDEIVISYYESEEPNIQAVLKWEKLVPPIAKGQKVATFSVTSRNGLIEKTVSLFATEEVKPTLLFALKLKMHDWGQGSLIRKGSLVAGIILLFSGMIWWFLSRN